MKKIFLSALIVLLLGACQTKKHFLTDMKAIHDWTENYMAAIKATDVDDFYHSKVMTYVICPQINQLYLEKRLQENGLSSTLIILVLKKN
jgi:hypothetical protein